ncbi:MAG: DUF962 domain-containing protein [Acidiferrobacterales bacterium]|nr:DUF962 domain-containing protein [Acidiferrobacterales bacterium]
MNPKVKENGPYRSFKEFYPYYLSEHQNRTSRRLHVVGTATTIILLILITVSQSWRYLILLPICGYGFAWVGHFFFEKNKPATFTYPRWSLMGDFVMLKDVLIGKIKF